MLLNLVVPVPLVLMWQVLIMLVTLVTLSVCGAGQLVTGCIRSMRFPGRTVSGVIGVLLPRHDGREIWLMRYSRRKTPLFVLRTVPAMPV